MDNLTFDAPSVSLPQVVVTEPSPVSVQTENAVSIVRKIESTPESAASGTTPESKSLEKAAATPISITDFANGAITGSVKQSLEQAAEIPVISTDFTNGAISGSTKQTSEQAAETSITSTDFANGATSGSVNQSLGQATATSRSSTNFESGQFVPTQEHNDCVIPVPEECPSQQLEDAALTPQPEQDNFRTAEEGCFAIYGIRCLLFYQNMWDAINSKYALPVWLLLLALPISAGYMGALYMYSCQACHSLPMLMFLIGICLLAELSFRICLIIRGMTSTEGEIWGNKLHILLIASSFLTVIFFITEAMLFWKMTPIVTHPGAPEYCDPHFVTYSFWWNCVMSVVMVPIFFCPA